MTDFQKLREIVKCLVLRQNQIERKVDLLDDLVNEKYKSEEHLFTLMGQLIVEVAGAKYDVKKIEEMLSE